MRKVHKLYLFNSNGCFGKFSQVTVDDIDLLPVDFWS